MFFRCTPRMASCWLVLAASALLSTPVFAESQMRFQTAFEQFMQAQSGDSAAIERAASSFTTLLQIEPGNPVVLAYAGASTAQLANTTLLPWKKLSYAEEGLAMLDKALAMLTPAHNAVIQNNTPGALEVRYVAANTFLAVPGFMNRRSRGAKLLTDVESSPLLAQAPLGFKGAVWMRAAKLAQVDQRPADARQLYEKVIGNHAPQAEMAREQLKALVP